MKKMSDEVEIFYVVEDCEGYAKQNQLLCHQGLGHYRMLVIVGEIREIGFDEKGIYMQPSMRRLSRASLGFSSSLAKYVSVVNGKLEGAGMQFMNERFNRFTYDRSTRNSFDFGVCFSNELLNWGQGGRNIPGIPQNLNLFQELDRRDST